MLPYHADPCLHDPIAHKCVRASLRCFTRLHVRLICRISEAKLETLSQLGRTGLVLLYGETRSLLQLDQLGLEGHSFAK